MRRARCASFYSSRLRNKDPAKASKQPGDCSLGTRAVVTRWRSRRNALLPHRATTGRGGTPLCCRFGQSAMRRRTMKYICFGYYDKGKFDGMTEGERNAMFDTCFDYDD